MASQLDIWNAALAALGQDPVGDPNEESANAQTLLARWPLVRDAALRKHAWNFAKKRANLAADAAAPEFQYAAAYTLPADCLRVIRLEDRPHAKWSVEGGKILTDEGAPLYLIYTRKVTDEQEFDAAFADLAALQLAEATGFKITQNRELVKDIGGRAKDAERAARWSGAIENPPDDDYFNSDWEASRL